MNTSPTLQTKLYGLEKIFSEITNLVTLKKFNNNANRYDENEILNNYDSFVSNLFTKSFEKWKVTDTQLREFVSSDIKIPIKKTRKKKKDKATPEFIKDVEFGPVRPK